MIFRVLFQFITNNYKFHYMSIYITFSALLIQPNPKFQHEQLHTFKLRIYSKQFNENFNWYSDGHHHGLIDLPSNRFVTSISSVLYVNIQQHLQGESQNDGFKVMSCSNIDFKLAQLENQPNSIKRDSIQLYAFNKALKFNLKYKYVYYPNKIFVGTICLDHQGHHQSKLTSVLKQIKKERKSNQEHISQNVIDADQTPIRILSRELKYQKRQKALVDCNQDQLEIETKNDPQLTKNTKLTLSYDQLQEIAQEQIPVNTVSNYTLATKGQHWKKLQQTKQTQDKGAHSLISLYKGPCKSRNIFSCLDPQVQGQTQLCLIEPIYR